MRIKSDPTVSWLPLDMPASNKIIWRKILEEGRLVLNHNHGGLWLYIHVKINISFPWDMPASNKIIWGKILEEGKAAQLNHNHDDENNSETLLSSCMDFSLDPSYRMGWVYKLKFCPSVCRFVCTSSLQHFQSGPSNHSRIMSDPREWTSLL